MSETSDNKLAEEACQALRRGIGRARKLAVEARQRLSELTSITVHPGPAGMILADARRSAEDWSRKKPMRGNSSPFS